MPEAQRVLRGCKSGPGGSQSVVLVVSVHNTAFIFLPASTAQGSQHQNFQFCNHPPDELCRRTLPG